MKRPILVSVRAALLASWVVCCVLSLSRVYATQQRTSFESEIVYVGLLEDDRRELIKENGSEPAISRVVIPAFRKDDRGWGTVHELKESVNWTVAFDGRNLGEVQTQPDRAPEVIVNPNPVESSGYAYAVQAVLTPPGQVPAVGQPSGQFAGILGGTVRRPLVVVSKPNFSDPDAWKRSIFPPELLGAVHAAFKQSYPHLRQCDKDGEPLRRDWEIRPTELQVIRAYRSNKGSFLVETQLAHRKCVFNVSGNDVKNLEANQWFYVGADQVALSLGLDMTLVDAGDYDGDGKSEVVFIFVDSDKDAEGYILFYEDFRRKATLVWH